jgi:23S rRNA pseudouridine1911/1915/1917 synthase
MNNTSTSPIIRLSTEWPSIEILFEDADLIAINKPTGLLLAQDPWDKERESLMWLLHNAVRAQRPWTVSRKLAYLANAHRMEAGTSGVALIARNKPALTNLNIQFKENRTRIQYTALVNGAPQEPEMEVNLPLAPCLLHPGLSEVSPTGGKPAITKISVLERFNGYSLIRAEPSTDRLHQIRVHLREIGCPLVADPDYGSGAPLLLSSMKKHYKLKREGERPLLGQYALHAERMEFIHPTTGETVNISAPWPKDLTVSIKYLRRYAG